MAMAANRSTWSAQPVAQVELVELVAPGLPIPLLPLRLPAEAGSHKA
jgi:hypothetical protein